MNKWCGIGRLTKDPELTTTNSGKSVVEFDIAVRSKQKGDDGEYKSEFFRCVAWGQMADNIAQYCVKGQRVGVTGELQTRSYERDGKRVKFYQIMAQEVEFLDKPQGAGNGNGTSEKPSQASNSKPAKPSRNDDGPPPLDDDDLPF